MRRESQERSKRKRCLSKPWCRCRWQAQPACGASVAAAAPAPAFPSYSIINITFIIIIIKDIFQELLKAPSVILSNG